MSGRHDDHEEPVMRGPIEWLFHSALLVLGAVIALTLALELVAAIWPWLAGAGLLIGAVALWLRVAAARRRDW